MATSSAFSTSNQYIKYTISIMQNSQSTSGNYSNVTVSVRFYRTNTGYSTYGPGTVYCKIDGTQYSSAVTASQKITENGIILFTKTLNISHNSSGAKNLTCSAWINHDRFTATENSYSQTLTNIPRKSTLVLGHGTLGTAQTLSVVRASTSFTHTISYICGNDSGTICTKSTSTSISWTPELSLANNAPNGNVTEVSISIETFNGTTSIGTNSYRITCAIPDTVKPSVTLSLDDANGYYSTYGAYIQTRSKFSVILTAQGAYNSAIRSYSTTADGSTYTGATFGTSVIRGSGSLTVTATVTDSRGRTGTASETVPVLAYNTPEVSPLRIKRCSSTGTANSGGAYLSVQFDSNVVTLQDMNSASYVIKYKKTSESAFTTETLTNYADQFAVSSGTYIFPADTTSNYDVVLEVTDNFVTVNKNGIGPSVKKFMSFLQNGLGIAFNKTAEKENGFEVAFDMYDKFGTSIGNGLAVYSGTGTSAIDPNTTLESLIITDKNVPVANKKMYIHTSFYNAKSTTSDRSQTAVSYDGQDSTYYRVCIAGAWSPWREMIDENNILDKVYPIGTYYVTHSSTSPASLFGGSWHRIESRFLWGAPSTSTLGMTGGEMTHILTTNEMPSHNHTYFNTYSNVGTITKWLPNGSVQQKAVYQYTGDTGGGAAHNNMPPYVTTAIWRREA